MPITPKLLSGSTSGQPIPVTVTDVSSAVTVHTAVSGTTDIDEVLLWASNITAAAATISLIVGGTGDAYHLLKSISVPPRSQIPILCRARFNGAAVLKAYASVASAINLHGGVDRIDLD